MIVIFKRELMTSKLISSSRAIIGEVFQAVATHIIRQPVLHLAKSRFSNL